MAKRALERFCSQIEELEVIASCSQSEEALKHINEEEIDLLLLDIELPGSTGLELLDKLPYLPRVIFCTSNTQYAYEAFQIDAVDFLKKPIVFRDLQKAISKLVELNKTAESAQNTKEEIYVKSNGRLIRLDFSEILYFENYGDYVKVHTTGEQIVFQSSLKSIESKLQGTQFLKVHRSYIVNLKKIVDIEENTLVIEQKVIPISRVNRPILMSKLDLL